MEKGISHRLKLQMILFLARRLPPCKTMLPLFSAARERFLTTREKITTKLHLFTCEACRRYVAQIELMSELVKPKVEEEVSVEETPAKLSPVARERIRDALKAAAHRKN
jgi:hypothetical protein